jgi:hypothetical protein
VPNRYQLYLKIEDVWQFVCEIEAANHSEAFGKAMMAMKPEHYCCQLRLEQVETKPVDPRGGQGE